MPLIDYEINIIQNQSGKFVVASNVAENEEAAFAITDAKLYFQF